MLVFTPKFEKIWQKFEFRGKNSELGKNFPELEHKLAELEHNLIELDQDSNSSKGQNSQEKKPACMYILCCLRIFCNIYKWLQQRAQNQLKRIFVGKKE